MVSEISKTQAEKLLQDLKRSPELYQLLFEKTCITLWITGPTGEVHLDVPGWRQYTGQTYDQIIGFQWLQALHPDDRDRILDEWFTILKGKSPATLDYRLWSVKNKTWHWVEAAAIPILSKSGTIRGWMGSINDISERKLARMLDEATSANQTLYKYLSYMHHEIKTPLTAAHSCVELLEQAGLTEAERSSYVEILKRSCIKINTYIDTLLSYARSLVAVVAPTVYEKWPPYWGEKPLLHKRVLVVEDNADVRLLLKKYLLKAGASVETAADGRSGITKALHQPYCDAMLLDMHLPQLSGREAIKRLREAGMPVPIIAISAPFETGNKEAKEHLGCADFISKPFTYHDLISRVRKAIEQGAEGRLPPS